MKKRQRYNRYIFIALFFLPCQYLGLTLPTTSRINFKYKKYKKYKITKKKKDMNNLCNMNTVTLELLVQNNSHL